MENSEKSVERKQLFASGRTHSLPTLPLHNNPFLDNLQAASQQQQQQQQQQQEQTTNEYRRPYKKPPLTRPKSVFVRTPSEVWIDLSHTVENSRTNAAAAAGGHSSTKRSTNPSTNAQPTTRVGVPIWQSTTSAVPYETTTLPSPPSEHRRVSRHYPEEKKRKYRNSLEQYASMHGLTLAEYLFDEDDFRTAQQKLAARQRLERERLQAEMDEVMARHKAELKNRT